MKFFIVTLIAMILISVVDGAGEELYNWDTLADDLHAAFSYKGNICISIGRRIGYNWRLNWNRLLDSEYALGTHDAEYFFYDEQKVRDQIYKRLKKIKRGEPEMSCCTFSGMKAAKKYHTARDYRKEEIYCREPENITQLKRYCTWALYNKRLSKEGWVPDDNFIPECEFRRIFLPRYGYKSKRTVLKCGYVTVKEDEPTRLITAFISAVDSPRPVHRLILYLFRSANASDPFKPASSAEEAGSSVDLSTTEPDIQTRIKRGRRPAKEEYTLPPLYLLTLLINRRYIFDHMKEELPVTKRSTFVY